MVTRLQAMISDELAEIFNDVYRNGTVTRNYGMHIMVKYFPVETITELEEQSNTCTECICPDHLTSLFEDFNMTLEYVGTYHEYRVTILIEHDEEKMKEECGTFVCHHGGL